MHVQTQQPDWQRLYLQGSCKFPNVPWTDAEMLEITKSGTFDMAVVAKLRSEYLKANEREFTDPTNKVKVEPIVETTEAIVEEPAVLPINEKLAKYEELYGKKPVGKYAKDEAWLDQKIADKQ